MAINKVLSAVAFGLSTLLAASSATALDVAAPSFGGDATDTFVPLDRLTTWNPGLNAVGGIPVRSRVCATIEAAAYQNGLVDASARITAAINSCPPGQVVQLSAGLFLVNNLILLNKGVTLRGAGPQATILKKGNGAIFGLDHGETDAQPIIVVGPTRWPKANDGGSQDLTADGEKGSHAVAVSRPRMFAVGQLVLVDANEFDAASWTALPNRGGKPTGAKIWASDRVVFMRHDPPQEYVDDPFPDSLSWFSRKGRPVSEVKEIASIGDGAISFTTPLHVDYPVSKVSQVTPYDCVHVRQAGVESLGVTGGSDGAIRFECAAYSWVKDVEISVWDGDGIAISSSLGIEVRDSYIHDAALSTPGGGAYALGFTGGSSENLIENCIILRANKMMVARSAGAGSVVAYNYVDDGFIDYDKGWQEVGLNGSHMVGSHSMLFEGNDAFNYDSDNTHGSAFRMMVFRNHLHGQRRSFEDKSNLRAAGLNYGSWWHTFAGNVLGVPGGMAGWVYEDLGLEADKQNAFHGAPAIWRLGYQAGQWEQATDPAVIGTVLRQGNFDYVTNDVQWDTPARPLPNSLYLTAKPAFFGKLEWPWVDALGSTKLHVLPARARYDAGTPFSQP